MAQTEEEQTAKSEPKSVTNAEETVKLPPEHPLADVVGSMQNEAYMELWWKEVQAYRRRVDRQERARLKDNK